MNADVASPQPLATRPRASASAGGLLCSVAVAAGIAWSLAFIGIGLGYRLQMYGDGAMFAYAVAVQDAWGIHWHNIPARLFVYLSCLAPAEAYVDLTRSVDGGLALYGLLFYGAQLIGLTATFWLDRTAGRPIFVCACASTACLCPLVFGFPTEMWMAHALFWLTLALCHGGRAGPAGFVAVLGAMLALVFTHEGAVVLEAVILLSLLPRGIREARFRRAAGAVAIAIAAWLAVKTLVRPDDYIIDVMERAKWEFFDPHIFTDSIFALEVAVLALYAALFVGLRRVGVVRAPLWSAAMVAAGLATYWILLDPPLHAHHRYYLRTALVLGLPCFAAVAVIESTEAAGWARRPIAVLSRWLALLSDGEVGRAVASGLVLLGLVNVVETGRFVAAWHAYTAAVRELATGSASDPQLGDPRFVSSERIDPKLWPLTWNSTTLFLSVMVAPGYKAGRLVIDPSGNYFWLTCAQATAQEHAKLAIPVESRGLIRRHACLHR